ncbi:MAG: Omp28-related outer membrane protein [Bacteroidales bacterium]
MKRITLLLLGLVVAFSACDKDDDDDDNNNGSSDITVKEQQEAYVLLTTATWCGYCGDWGIPTFDGAFAGDDGIDPGKVNGLSLHYSDSDPMYHSMAATMKSELGIGGPPNLWIEFDNSFNLNPSGWISAVKARQSENSPDCGVGLEVDQSGDDFTVDVRVKFFNSVSGTYNLAVYVAEDGIVENQSGSTQDHVHKEVLRGEITSGEAWGIEMFSGDSPGDYTDSFSFSADSDHVADNLKFVAVVYEMQGGAPVASPNSNTR